MSAITTDPFLKKYKILCVLIFCLVLLGGAIRTMSVGHACPDWPLCFGDYIPDYRPQIYIQFIHRVMAFAVALLTVHLNLQILRAPQVKIRLKLAAVLVLVILLAQGVLGGMTVLIELSENLVTLHLALATAFFALTYWIYLTLDFENSFSGDAVARKAQLASAGLLIFIYVQILLGGLVATHYAALVCTDFPFCNGEFIPTLDGIIGLHIIHRLGAYALALVVLGYYFYIKFKVNCDEMKKWTEWLLTIFMMEITVGIANVIYYTPPLITVFHLTVGTALLGVAVRLLRISSLQT